MHPASSGVDLLRQAVRVGRLQFGQRTVFQDQAGQIVILRQFLQHILSGGRLSLWGFADYRQSLLFKQDLLQLHWGAQVKVLAGGFVGFDFKIVDLLADLCALPRQQPAVDQNTPLLHPGQHRDQRNFNVDQDMGQSRFLLQARPQMPV